MLDVIFLPHEAELIKSIPLSVQLPEDKLIWAGNNNGKFSVKSAYRLAVEGARFDSGPSSDDRILRRFWRYVWRIPVPHKVRHFAWRVCHNILPTKENLMRRKVLQDDWCEECKDEAKTTGHLFWRCPRDQEVWQHTKLHFSFDPHSISSFFDLLWNLMVVRKYDEERVAMVVTVAWAIWANRNEVRNGKRKRTGRDIVQWTSQYLAGYLAANDSPRFTSPETLIPHWTPPMGLRYKVNVDGAVFRSQKTAGVGVVVRDSNGLVVAALSRKINSPLGALEVEAKAVEAGISFARDIGIADFTVEGDSLVVYNSLSGQSDPPSSVAHVISGILGMYGIGLWIDFSHIRRQGNRPAHLLAKYASNLDDYMTWMEENPCFLEQALLHDVSSFS